MAILAGVGNPVGGSNPAGVGTGLNYIGNHAYAQSGPFAKDTNSHVMLEFTMSGSYFDGFISFHGTTDASTPANGNINAFTVMFNGSAVMLVKTDSSDENSPHSLNVPLLIPPYTIVQVLGQDYSGGSTGDTTVTMTGRIYA